MVGTRSGTPVRPAPDPREVQAKGLAVQAYAPSAPLGTQRTDQREVQPKVSARAASTDQREVKGEAVCPCGQHLFGWGREGSGHDVGQGQFLFLLELGVG
jgi:hypothetical protein